MLYEVLWKIVIIVVVFLMYAALGVAIVGLTAFRAVNKKSKNAEAIGENTDGLEKAS